MIAPILTITKSLNNYPNSYYLKWDNSINNNSLPAFLAVHREGVATLISVGDADLILPEIEEMKQ